MKYMLRFRVGNHWHEVEGFGSIQEAERYRITKTSACEWSFYKYDEAGKYAPVLCSGADFN